MASPSASSSYEDLAEALNQRKRKRMLSNRESARRSRLRKQKHLDDMVALVAQLRRENSQILTSYNVITQQLVAIVTENSVLKSQATELSHRLQSVMEIILHMDGPQSMDGFFAMPWSSVSMVQPILASPDL
ncbi:G-box binding factor 6 [Wolffia australiana]